MIRATTPTHQFVVDIDPREWDKFIITYKQCGKIVIEKTESDNVSMEAIDGDDSASTMYRISFRLSQLETKLFTSKSPCDVQIRCHYPDGNSFASDIIHLRIDDVLNDEVMGDAN